jgi:hypothetical protein
MSPEEAVQRYQIPRPAGSRTVVMTFTGDVSLDSDRTLDASEIEDKGLRELRSVQISTDADGHTVAVVGMNGDGCARLSSPAWKRKGEDKKASILLDVQT